MQYIKNLFLLYIVSGPIYFIIITYRLNAAEYEQDPWSESSTF